MTKPARRDERGNADVQLVRQLQPEVLHRVIQICGLEECAELVAMASVEQLQRVFDLDVWRARRAGRDEELDADRFILWLDLLRELGPEVAAEKLEGIGIDLVVAALAQQVQVFDRAALETSGREELECDIGGYVVRARHADSWSSIVDFLLLLDGEHPTYFHRLMSGCRKLSNTRFEADGLDELLADSEQKIFDLAAGRAERREKQGYVSPEQARAFLQASRQVQPAAAVTPPECRITREYFRAIESVPAPDADAQLAAVLAELRRAGVLPGRRPPMLDAPATGVPRFPRLDAYMQQACEGGDTAYSATLGELAYLANALMAGCGLQERAFTAAEGSDAAAAVCNLGLENRPAEWRAERMDLVSVFQVGWTILHRDVCMYAAEQLIRVVADLQTWDRDVQAGLDALRRNLSRECRAGTPWRARAALEVMIMLDQPAWAALRGLIAECPVMHAALGAARHSSTRSVAAADFQFISENRHIAAIHEYLESLPERLHS